MPKVSIIIPTYNHARYLPEAVRSVLAQTFADWEAIIVDDGSTDDTAAVAAQFTDPRVRYIYQENRGPNAARNTGIRAAQGEYIALLDADDAWQPPFLERMVGLLNADASIGAVYCGYQYMDAAGVPLKLSICRVVPPERFHEEMLRGNWLSLCTVVARKSVYSDVELFDESLWACEDTDMWIRTSAKHRFVGIPEVLVWCRRTGASNSSNIDRMSQSKKALLEKHLGSLATPVETWSEVKRAAVSELYSYRAQECLAQGRVAESAEAMRWLLQYRSDLALSLHLWYSLACVHQLVGQRGDFETWDVARGQADALGLLDALADGGVSPEQLRIMRGQAYLALALLNYGKGRLGTARRFLLRGLWQVPGLLFQRAWLRLAVRLLPGVARWRRRRSRPDVEQG